MNRDEIKSQYISYIPDKKKKTHSFVLSSSVNKEKKVKKEKLENTEMTEEAEETNI